MYEIRNITNSPHPIRLADGTMGRISARATGTFDVHPKAINEYKRSGYLLVSDATDNREQSIRSAINALSDDDDDHWTNDGRPDVHALNDHMPEGSERVTAAERDDAWSAMQAEAEH